MSSSGYFGDEPTCGRCDYPRRLHRLLRVDHDYEEAPTVDPVVGATGGEGPNPTPSLEKESVMTVPQPTDQAEIPEADATMVTPIATRYVGTAYHFQIEVSLERIERHGHASGPDGPNYSLIFDAARPGDMTEVLPADIPALIDALTELYRMWRDAESKSLLRDEEAIRQAASVREDR